MFHSKIIICWMKEWVILGSPLIYWNPFLKSCRFLIPYLQWRVKPVLYTLLLLKSHFGAQQWGNMKFTFLLLWHSTKKNWKITCRLKCVPCVWCEPVTQLFVIDLPSELRQFSGFTCHTQTQYFLYSNGFECSLPRKEIQILVIKLC